MTSISRKTSDQLYLMNVDSCDVNDEREECYLIRSPSFVYLPSSVTHVNVTSGVNARGGICYNSCHCFVRSAAIRSIRELKLMTNHACHQFDNRRTRQVSSRLIVRYQSTSKEDGQVSVTWGRGSSQLKLLGTAILRNAVIDCEWLLINWCIRRVDRVLRFWSPVEPWRFERNHWQILSSVCQTVRKLHSATLSAKSYVVARPIILS